MGSTWRVEGKNIYFALHIHIQLSLLSSHQLVHRTQTFLSSRHHQLHTLINFDFGNSWALYYIEQQ